MQNLGFFPKIFWKSGPCLREFYQLYNFGTVWDRDELI